MELEAREEEVVNGVKLLAVEADVVADDLGEPHEALMVEAVGDGLADVVDVAGDVVESVGIDPARFVGHHVVEKLGHHRFVSRAFTRDEGTYGGDLLRAIVEIIGVNEVLE